MDEVEYTQYKRIKNFRWEARFSAPVKTGPNAHTVSYKMGTGSLFRGSNGFLCLLKQHILSHVGYLRAEILHKISRLSDD